MFVGFGFVLFFLRMDTIVKKNNYFFAKGSLYNKGTFPGHQNDRWYEQTGGERLLEVLHWHEQGNCCSLENETCDLGAQRT